MRSPAYPGRTLEAAVGWTCVIAGTVGLGVLLANPPAAPTRPAAPVPVVHQVGAGQ